MGSENRRGQGLPSRPASDSPPPESVALLKVLLLLDTTEIPEDMLRNNQVQQPIPDHPRAEHFDQARDELLGESSLGLWRNEDTKALSMGQGLHEATRRTMNDEEFAMSFEGAVELLASHWHRRLKDLQGADDVLNHILELAAHFGYSDELGRAIGPSSRKTFLSLLAVASA